MMQTKRETIQIQKGTLVLCPVYTTREVKITNKVTECYNGDLFLGVVAGLGKPGMAIVNLSPLGKYKAPINELLPVVQTDASPEILAAIKTIEDHSKRMQKIGQENMALLVEDHY